MDNINCSASRLAQLIESLNHKGTGMNINEHSKLIYPQAHTRAKILSEATDWFNTRGHKTFTGDTSDVAVLAIAEYLANNKGLTLNRDLAEFGRDND